MGRGLGRLTEAGVSLRGPEQGEERALGFLLRVEVPPSRQALWLPALKIFAW